MFVQRDHNNNIVGVFKNKSTDAQEHISSDHPDLLAFYNSLNTYRHKRAEDYPPFGDAADIAYKQRQKARMQIGKARAAIENGDLATALTALMEAVEPVEDAKDYDGQVSATKKKYPKPDADQGGA